MVTQAFCDRWRRTLISKANPDFQAIPPYPDYEYGDHCGVNIRNMTVERILSSSDAVSQHGAIYRWDDRGYEKAYGSKMPVLEGDIPILGWKLKKDRKLTGTKTKTDQRLIDRLSKCGCELGRKHEHYPAIHVHFKCVRDKAIICAMEHALEES